MAVFVTIFALVAVINQLTFVSAGSVVALVPSQFHQAQGAIAAASAVVFPAANTTFTSSPNITDRFSVVSEAQRLLQSGKPVAVIGSGASELSETTQLLVRQTPGLSQIGFSSTSNSLSNKQLYPNFLRFCPSDGDRANSIAEMIAAFGWKRVAILEEASEFGFFAAEGVVNALKPVARVTTRTPVACSGCGGVGGGTLTSQEWEDITQALERIKHSHTRVILLLARPAIAMAVLRLACDARMSGKGWQWLGTDWALPEAFTSLPSLPGGVVAATQCAQPSSLRDQFVGSLGVVPWYNRSAAAAAALPSQVVPGGAAADAAAMDPYAAYAYDAVLAAAAAARLVAANSGGAAVTPAAVSAALRGTLLGTGLTGPLLLDAATGERSWWRLAIVNLKTAGTAAGTQWMEVGSVVGGAASSTLRVETAAVVWPGGEHSISPDRVGESAGSQAWFLVLVLSLLMIATLLSTELERFGIHFPHSALAVVLGVVAGAVIHGSRDASLVRAALFDERMFLLLLLPVIVFESGFNMRHKTLFFRSLLPILLYAILGTILLTLLVGLALFAAIAAQESGGVTGGDGAVFYASSQLQQLSPPPFLPRMSLWECMGVGSLLAATDPVATLSVMSALGAPPLLRTLVHGESTLNDAAAIVMFTVCTSFMTSPVHGGSVAAGALRFLTVLLASLAVGVAVALLGTLVLKRMAGANTRFVGGDNNSSSSGSSADDSSATTSSGGETKGAGEEEEEALASAAPARLRRIVTAEAEVGLVLLLSYLSFELAEGVHQSGIVASLASGLTMNYYMLRNMSPRARALARRLFRLLATLSETLIFIQVGMNVLLLETPRNMRWGLVALTLPLLLVGRLFMILGLTSLVNCRRSKRKRITMKYQVMLWHAGLRGAIAYALAVTFPSQNRPHIIAATMWIILFTLFLQGCSARAVLRLLGIPLQDSSSGGGGDSAHDGEEEDDANISGRGRDGSRRAGDAPPSGLLRDRAYGASRPAPRQPLPAWLAPAGRFNAHVLLPLLTLPATHPHVQAHGEGMDSGREPKQATAVPAPAGSYCGVSGGMGSGDGEQASVERLPLASAAADTSADAGEIELAIVDQFPPSEQPPQLPSNNARDDDLDSL